MKKALLTAMMILVILSSLLVSSTAIAQGSTPGSIADVSIQTSSITWTPSINNLKGMMLTITGPNGFYLQKQYEANAHPAIASADFGDGTYVYELVLWPNISPNLKTDPALRGLNSQSAISMKQSGAFTVTKGSFVTAAKEPSQGSANPANPNGQITPLDVVNADDFIVQGSICAGFDCVNNESFGFDTIRLKENNTRIGFMDTSVGAFPSNDWTIVANDSASGGASFLGFEDVTGAKFPFKVMAGAPTNSLFVSSNGDLGVGTSTPVLDFHANTSDTPGVRLEQNAAGGFTAQTWDIAGNEANFFVRDVTGGSRLPFRIRPGAPTSAIDVAASGNVGIGTSSPVYDLDVANTGADTTLGVRRTDGVSATLKTSATEAHLGTTNNFPLLFDVNNTNIMTLATSGNVGIGTSAPGYDLDVSNTGVNTILGVRRTDGVSMLLQAGGAVGHIGTANNFPLWFDVNNVNKMVLATSGALTVSGPVNATAFNTTSDRNAKENFAAINQKSVLDRLSDIPISTWNFIENDNKTKHMGPMAQDFYAAFGLGADDKHISTVDADGVAFAAIQELNKNNQALASENASLQSKVDDLSARISALEAGGAPTGPSSQNILIIVLVSMNLGLIALVVWAIRRGSFSGSK